VDLVPPIDAAVPIVLDVFTLPSKEEAKDKLKIVWEKEKKILNEILNISHPTVSISLVEPSQEKVVRNSMFNIMSTAATSQTHSPVNEFESYFAEEVADEKVGPLKFWETNETRFPVLSRLAMRYLAIPATSAGIERVFSIAGAIANASSAKASVKTMCTRLMIRQFRKPVLRKKVVLSLVKKKNAEKIYYR